MKEVDILQPRAFTKFCMSIGAVPSSYIAGLTIEEQLLWFCSYLENQVIPAVNNNGEAVTELQNLYVQLKDYVDHYFDNLDIQEEINNKLDDMAESGELADVIAQYLQLAGVLAYNTKDDMKAAENLAEGSICKTLGDVSFNDGEGQYYKVRQVQNTDNIDNINIIALHDPDLVAEIIPTKNEVPITNITLGCFHKAYSETNKKSYLFLSTDNYNFSKIPNIEINNNDNDVFSDPFIVWDPYNKQFIITTDDQSEGRSCTIATTKDLVHYTYYHITLNFPITVGNNKFSPTLFWYNNELYLLLSVNESGYTVGNWHIMCAKCNDLVNMTFDDPFEITYEGNDDIYDISIMYYNNKFYMTGSSQTKYHPQLYESSSLTSEFAKTNDNLFEMAGGINACEGSRISLINDIMYVQTEFHNYNIIVIGILDPTNHKITKQHLIPSLARYKAGHFINLSDYAALEIIQNLNVAYVNDSTYNTDTYVNTITMNEDTTIDNLTLVPNTFIVLNGNYNLTINNILDPFNIKTLPMIINSTKTDIRIKAYKSDTDFDRTFSYDHNVAHSKYKEFRFNYYTTSDSYDDYINRFGNLTQHNDMSTAFSQWFYGYCWEVNKVKSFAIAIKASATSCTDLKIATINANITPKIDTFVPLMEGTGKIVGTCKIGADGYIYATATGMTVGYAYTLSGTFI